jgi:hypothetical protein
MATLDTLQAMNTGHDESMTTLPAAAVQRRQAEALGGRGHHRPGAQHRGHVGVNQSVAAVSGICRYAGRSTNQRTGGALRFASMLLALEFRNPDGSLTWAAYWGLATLTLPWCWSGLYALVRPQFLQRSLARTLRVTPPILACRLAAAPLFAVGAGFAYFLLVVAVPGRLY